MRIIDSKFFIANFAALVFTFITNPALATGTSSVIYEGTHNFSTCLERAGCSEQGSWGICGSNKYPYSDQRAGEMTSDVINFSVLQRTKVTIETKNIKKCFNGCKGWFDRQVSGEWRYVGGILWEAEPGKYRLHVQSDGYVGCGAPYIQQTFCPSSCIVRLNAYPAAAAVDSKDAVVIDSPPKTAIGMDTPSPISMELPQGTIAGVVDHDPAANLPIASTEIDVPLSFSNLPVDAQISILADRIKSTTDSEKRKKMNGVMNSLLQKKASKEIFDIWLNYTGMMTDKVLGYLPVIGPYYTTGKVIYQVTQNQWSDAFLTASTLITKQLHIGKKIMPSVGTTSSLSQDYYQAFNNHFKPTGKASGGVDFSILSPTPLSN